MIAPEIASDLLALAHASEPQLLAIPDNAASSSSAPDKWSRKQILGHLIDSAANNHQRFIRMQQAPELRFPGYQQNDWVRLNHYATRPWSELVALWAAYNRHLAHVIEHIAPETLTHQWDDGSTRCDLAFVAADYVVHLRHHLNQLLESPD